MWRVCGVCVRVWRVCVRVCGVCVRVWRVCRVFMRVWRVWGVYEGVGCV